METIVAGKNNISKIPFTPGVYLFKDETGRVIYVGKAKVLRNRLRSYWAFNLINKTRQMMDEARTLSYIKVGSEFESLLLESALVKKYVPKYNIELKDDKSPLYIGITREQYPRVLPFRQTQLQEKDLKEVYGPFINGRTARSVLKRVRQIIPFSTHKPTQRACMYEEIGLCNPCPSVIEHTSDILLKKKLKRKYQRNIHKIRRLLEGDIEQVQKLLQKEVKQYSDNEEYEMARDAQRSHEILNRMIEPKIEISGYIENPNLLEDIRIQELKHLRRILQKHIRIDRLSRIECYDIAHLAGTYPTASMVTFIDGEADKGYYRHFRIKGEKGNSDVDNMKEVLKRRKKHISGSNGEASWGKSDLIIVDGGKGQVNAALEVFSDEFPVIGLAKMFETIIIPLHPGFAEIRAHGPALRLIQRIRDEAHRFARRYHHNLVSKAIKDSGRLN